MTVKLTKVQAHLVRLALEGYAKGLRFKTHRLTRKLEAKVEILKMKFPSL